MDYSPDTLRHLLEDEVIWLTTVSDRGAPVPNPVWFVSDGDELIIFTSPDSRRVHNLQRRPLLALHFNSDEHGGDFAIIDGTAELTFDQLPSANRPYIDKYAKAIAELPMTVEAFDATYSTLVRVRPHKVRTG